MCGPFTVVQGLVIVALWVVPTVLVWLSNRATRLMVRDVLDLVLDQRKGVDRGGDVSAT